MLWQNSVSHGTIRPPESDFHRQNVVPRETSCILDPPLLDFRSRGNIWLESLPSRTKKVELARRQLR